MTQFLNLDRIERLTDSDERNLRIAGFAVAALGVLAGIELLHDDLYESFYTALGDAVASNHAAHFWSGFIGLLGGAALFGVARAAFIGRFDSNGWRKQ